MARLAQLLNAAILDFSMINPLFKGDNHFFLGLRDSASLLHECRREVEQNKFNRSILWQKF
jgi:hypothetical protein